MIFRKHMLHITCFALSGTVLQAFAEGDAAPEPSLTVGIAGQTAPRYSGSDKRHWQMAPVVQARDGAFFLDSQKGIGYDLQTQNGLYLEHTLGYSLGRSDKDSSWRNGSNTLRGMGNIDAAVNTAVAIGWSVTPWLVVEGKATLPLSDSQGVNYQTSVTLIPLQTQTDTVAFQSAALFGDSRYMNTFYGVSEKQSERTSFTPYHAAGGFYGVDSSLTWSHQFTPNWGTALTADYTWLGAHADDSPIVERRNNTSGTLALLYTF